MFDQYTWESNEKLSFGWFYVLENKPQWIDIIKQKGSARPALYQVIPAARRGSPGGLTVSNARSAFMIRQFLSMVCVPNHPLE